MRLAAAFQGFSRIVNGRTDGRIYGRTDGRTYGRTDRPSYRDARTHLKTARKCQKKVTNDGPTKWCIELCVRRLEMRSNSTEWHLKMDNRKLIFRFPANKQLHGVLIVVFIVVPWPFQRARSRMLQKTLRPTGNHLPYPATLIYQILENAN